MKKKSKNKKASEVTRRILLSDPFYYIKKSFSSSGEPSGSIGFIESVSLYPTKVRGQSRYYMRNVERIEMDSSFIGCYLILDCGHHTFHPDIKSIYMEQFCIDCFNKNYFKHYQQNHTTSAS